MPGLKSTLITELIASLFSEYDYYLFFVKKNVIKEKLKKSKVKSEIARLWVWQIQKTVFSVTGVTGHTFIPKWQHLPSWISMLYAICRAIWRPENLEGKRSNRRSFNGKGFTSISFKVCYWFALLHVCCKYILIFWICKGTSTFLNLRILKRFCRCWIRETIWWANIFWHFLSDIKY